MQETTTIFSEEALKQLPVFYKYLTRFETIHVGELKITARFSESQRHFSVNYLNYSLHKPISDLEFLINTYE